MPEDIINFKSIQIDRTGKCYDLTNMDDLITVCDILFPQDFLNKFNNVHGYYPTKKECKQQIEFIADHSYDKKINPEILIPSNKLLANFYDFIEYISSISSVIGNKLVEIGIGLGGLSYIAKRLGFEIICSDLNAGIFEYQQKWDFLNLKPVYFCLGKSSILSIINSKVDIIYLKAVHFNRRKAYISPKDIGDEHWFDTVEEWLPFLNDMFFHLNKGGYLICRHNYGIPPSLAKKIINKLEDIYKNNISVKFGFSHFELKNCQITDIVINKLG